MTTFTNGPAHGVTLMLRRTPFLLRVTFNPHVQKDQWDALNYLEDRPEKHETLYAYKVSKFRGGVHLLIRGKNRKAGGFYQNADYEYVQEQPSDEIMRDEEKWSEWCHSPEFCAEYDRMNKGEEL